MAEESVNDKNDSKTAQALPKLKKLPKSYMVRGAPEVPEQELATWQQLVMLIAGAISAVFFGLIAAMASFAIGDFLWRADVVILALVRGGIWLAWLTAVLIVTWVFRNNAVVIPRPYALGTLILSKHRRVYRGGWRILIPLVEYPFAWADLREESLDVSRNNTVTKDGTMVNGNVFVTVRIDLMPVPPDVDKEKHREIEERNFAILSHILFDIKGWSSAVMQRCETAAQTVFQMSTFEELKSSRTAERIRAAAVISLKDVGAVPTLTGVRDVNMTDRQAEIQAIQQKSLKQVDAMAALAGSRQLVVDQLLESLKKAFPRMKKERLLEMAMRAVDQVVLSQATTTGSGALPLLNLQSQEKE